MFDFVAAGRLLLAACVGGALGWERGARQRPAGLRTHIAVALASALIMVLADRIVGAYASDLTNVDPMRVLEAVVSGVAFLGAGTIIFNRGEATVQGLTTAAGLLVTGALGIAARLGAYDLVAVGLTGARAS